MVAGPARHGVRALVIVATTAIAVIAVATSGLAGTSITDHVGLPLATMTTAVGVAAYSILMMRSELASRSRSVLDPLTGATQRGKVTTVVTGPTLFLGQIVIRVI